MGYGVAGNGVLNREERGMGSQGIGYRVWEWV